MKLPSNCTQVVPGMYIVRTQAGFKKAMKHFCGRDSDLWKAPDGYPTAYPALVSFSIEYRGYHYLHARCVHTNVLRAVI